MMLIDTFVAKSTIHGTGLFSNEPIKANSQIWKFHVGFDVIITIEQLETMPLFQRKFFETYCYMNDGKLYYCVDNARFMNHSDGPNTYEKPDGTYAARDIEAGEELTCDYSNFGLTPEDLTFNNSIFINSEENKLVVKSQ